LVLVLQDRSGPICCDLFSATSPDGQEASLIRLSRITDYGIVLMAHLAEQPQDAPRNAREVAAETRLPLPVVSKVLKSLARAGLLVSQRGAKGGYALARPAGQITVPEMIVALEGPIGLTECSQHPGTCRQEHTCHVRTPWQHISRAVQGTLARITLSDLVTPNSKIVPLASLGVDTRGIDTPAS
jgi:FeS assembly SUF system regulator